MKVVDIGAAFRQAEEIARSFPIYDESGVTTEAHRLIEAQAEAYKKRWVEAWHRYLEALLQCSFGPDPGWEQERDEAEAALCALANDEGKS